MTRRAAVVLLVTAALGLAAVPASPAYETGIQMAPHAGHSDAGSVPNTLDAHHVLARVRANPSGLDQRLARLGARIDRVLPIAGWVEIATPKNGAPSVRDALRHDPAIAAVALSYVRHISTIPNDPLWSLKQTRYFGAMRLDRAWDLSKGAGVTV